MKKFAATWITLSLAFLAGAAQAADCRDVAFEDLSFTVCTADPANDALRLFLNDEEGKPYGTFDNVQASGAKLQWAMNGGMYHPDRSPVGLYIEKGVEQARIVTRDGPGNFGLLPNGVLCIEDRRASVIEARRFAADPPGCRFATQSGPMLVIEGALHPRFLKNSDSLHHRNGVGVAEDGTLYAAISNDRINFHTFARLFRDVLGTPNALYLDGKVSRLYAPELNRHDLGFPMGPIFGVSE